jgi:MFS family permease
MIKQHRSQSISWMILGLVALTMFGTFYVYDSIGPVADLLQRQRGFSDTQIGILNAIYSLPNVVLILVGGFLVDRFGAARMIATTAAVCFLGAALTAFSKGFAGMATGRLLFGVGAETLNIAGLAAIAEYFAGGGVALAMALCMAIARAGSYSADMSPSWFPHAYALGWQSPLVIAAGIAGISLCGAVAYWWIENAVLRSAIVTTERNRRPFVPGDLLRFGTAYWFLLALCVLWYAVIFAFRSTFSIKYFQHAHGLDLSQAGTMNSYVFLAAMFTTPAFGWLFDRVGRFAPMLAFGALLLPLSIAIMLWTHWTLWVATALIGVSFSLVPAVMWPAMSKLVPRGRFGTALGFMWVAQNAGIACANLIAGWLNDVSGASALNPAGYQPMMLFFGGTSMLGFGFALLLWFTASRQHNGSSIRGVSTSQ